nr:hypothetical protein [Micromonospora sp. DSM 115978]
MLGFDVDVAATESALDGLLGFAVERTDHTENERFWLNGFKTFAETDTGRPPGTSVSTAQHPVQDFQWSDFTVKPGHSYTYRVVAMRGTPAHLVPSDEVDVTVTAQPVDSGTHSVIFNRGVAGSQAYARKFGNKTPDEAGPAAFTWLSRG